MAKANKAEKVMKPNIFMRIGLFIKQIIDELRKVVTPTAKLLATSSAEDYYGEGKK